MERKDTEYVIDGLKIDSLLDQNVYYHIPMTPKAFVDRISRMSCAKR